MYIKVKVAAGAKNAHIKRLSDDSFAVSVREPKERNMANKAVLRAVSSYLNIPLGKLRIMSGHRKLSKIISVSNGG